MKALRAVLATGIFFQALVFALAVVAGPIGQAMAMQSPQEKVEPPEQEKIESANTEPTNAEPAEVEPENVKSANAAPAKAEGGRSWKDLAAKAAGQIFLGAEKGVIFYAFDTLAYPGKSVDLVASVAKSRDPRGMVGAKVGFYDGNSLLGEATTDKSGRASIKWTPPKACDYNLTARIITVPKGESEEMTAAPPAQLLVACRKKDTKFVVIDLDHTVVDSSFFRVLIGGAKPMSDSAKITRKIARKYSIIYLTHRPDLLTRKSKSWLKKNKYPSGPLLVSKLKEAFGDSGKFKTARLKDVRKTFPGVLIGIGDKLSDAQAYVDNGLTAYLIPHYKRDKAKDSRKMSKRIKALNGRGRLHVVDGWGEIDAGIFKNRKYPPEAYVRRLDARAEQLEREKEKDDDDDDDDDDKDD